MGRKKERKNPDLRDKKIEVGVTAEEKVSIRTSATGKHQTISEWSRQVMLEQCRRDNTLLEREA